MKNVCFTFAGYSVATGAVGAKRVGTMDKIIKIK